MLGARVVTLMGNQSVSVNQNMMANFVIITFAVSTVKTEESATLCSRAEIKLRGNAIVFPALQEIDVRFQLICAR